MASNKKPTKMSFQPPSSPATVLPRRSLHPHLHNTRSAQGLKWDMPGASGAGENRGAGTKPVADPMDLKQLAVVLAMHACRQILVTITPERKVALYTFLLTIGSVMCDFAPLPSSYMSNKGNFLNVYFAKWSWLWTLLVVGGFIGLTSHVYCCGDRVRIRRHLYRLAIGTLVWYICTQAFMVIESLTGLCVGAGEIRPGLDRHTCLKKPGYRWRGFDISGHTFLLIYCNLLIHEEARAIRGFERIRDLIRNHDTDEDSPLRTLTPNELHGLKDNHDKLSGYVKWSFISLTGLAIMWDVTLVGTVLYFHTMAQKVAGGVVAVAAWFVTYRMVYLQPWSPGLPGQGQFKYADSRIPVSVPASEFRRRSLVGVGGAGPVKIQLRGGAGNGGGSQLVMDNQATTLAEKMA